MSDVPAALAAIVEQAFTGTAATAGFAGATVWMAIRFGIARGVFSNEAGLGSAPIAHAAARTDDPVRQGTVGMLGTFIDTLVVCTMTALVIVLTGAWTGGETGGPLSTIAFNTGLPGSGHYVVTVRCGGCHNHRMGLYDMVLIKENHIAAAGSIAQAVATARQQSPGLKIDVEVENLDQLVQAIEARTDLALLDNFELEDMRQAVELNAGRIELEASGGIHLKQIAEIAATGVDYISVGALTKDVQAIDLSMRFMIEG